MLNLRDEGIGAHREKTHTDTGVIRSATPNKRYCRMER